MSKADPKRRANIELESARYRAECAEVVAAANFARAEALEDSLADAAQRLRTYADAHEHGPHGVGEAAAAALTYMRVCAEMTDADLAAR